uniref:Uncharacterized protein LOC100179627 n=1 Tax=Phallusia mammillata TaxID=59560 RepID=A0A6F9DHT0_9ASCI|nr:uncharacterized protein LOC100179627 [Phallusia mammillata]
MAAELQPTVVFVNFFTQIGLREETAQKLWQAGIRKPQDLAGSSKEKIGQIVDDVVLVDHIHPVLQKYTYPIALAKDPFERALTLLRKESGEPEAQPQQAQNQNQMQTQSDATGFVPNSGVLNGNAESSSLRSAVMGLNTDVHMTEEPTHIHHTGNSASVNISGGTFVQSNILPQKEVVYNNTDTKIVAQTTIEAPKPAVVYNINLSKLSFPKAPQFLLAEALKVWNVMNVLNQDDPKAYPVKANWGRSRALIINNINLRAYEPRLGASDDSKNLRKLLQQIDFQVESHTDKTKENIFQILREFTASRDNANAPMILVFIGSHGARDAKQDYFFGTDGEKISDEEVVNFFTDTAAPLIKKEIPKLFFFQFCRLNSENNQTTQGQGTQSDSFVEVEAPRSFEWLNETTQSDSEKEGFVPAQKHANMLFAYATAPGSKAYRNTQSGSWFVTALCKTLMQHYATEDLLSMLTMVNKAVMEEKGKEENDRTVVQMCEVKSYLTKKVRFY